MFDLCALPAKKQQKKRAKKRSQALTLFLKLKAVTAINKIE